MTSWAMAMNKAREQQRKAQSENSKLVYEINGWLYHVNKENGNLTKYTTEEMKKLDNE